MDDEVRPSCVTLYRFSPVGDDVLRWVMSMCAKVQVVAKDYSIKKGGVCGGGKEVDLIDDWKRESACVFTLFLRSTQCSANFEKNFQSNVEVHTPQVMVVFNIV